VQPRPIPRRRLILAHREHASGRLDLGTNTPPGNRTNAGEGGFGSFGAEWRALGFWFVGSTDPDRYANAKEAGRHNEIPTNIRAFLRSSIRPCRPASKR
jgi:hypothetical protein